MEFFLQNVHLKVFIFLKVCDSDQVELEEIVLNSPKFYNHEYLQWFFTTVLCNENRSVQRIMFIYCIFV